MEQIQQKIKEQEELAYYSVLFRNSCAKQLKLSIDSLLFQVQIQLNNCKSTSNDHNLQMTIFFSFFTEWITQNDKKLGFAKQSSVQFKNAITLRLNSFTQQAQQCLNSKQQSNSSNDYTSKRESISPASRILNILSFFQRLKEKIGKMQRTITQKMDSILQKLPLLSPNMKKALNKELLQRQSQPYISLLCTNYREFRHIKQIQFSQKTKVKVQQYLQKFLKENNEKSQFYQQSSNIIFSQFEKSITLYNQNPTRATRQDLANEVKQIVNRLEVERILGKLFALCSIIKKENSCSTIYFQPHVSQVIATLALLKIDERTVSLQNNLVEIHTGEGKSIVLGISACYLALRGFQVYHSCYSPILIHRDKLEFKELYKQLKIQERIIYGSFQETCEKILPERFKEQALQNIQKSNLSIWFTRIKAKLSETVSQTIQSIKDLFKANLQQFQQKTKKVLLLDEVDVLLSPDYYNRLYVPTLDITDFYLQTKYIAQSKQDLITKLFLEIYEETNKEKCFNFMSIDQLKNSQKIIIAFPQLKQILFRIAKEIVHAGRSKNKIKELSKSLSFKEKFKSQKCNSYLQLMAGVAMFKKGNISYDDLKKSLKIRIKLCELSYSELPKYFSSIIGASGTLKALSQRKRNQIIQQYQMNSLYFLPTIYREKKFNQQRVCFQKSNSKYLQTLSKNISSHLYKNGKRAVLVIFEDLKSLEQFKKSIGFKKLLEKYIFNQLVLNKDGFDYTEISSNIIKATQANTFTLATKQFARGIDFKDEVGLDQGLFVIIAYLPDSEEEYLQAKGRTARAGKNGKVLLCAHEELEIDSQNEESGLRRLFINKEQAKRNEMKDSIESVKLRHKNTLEVYTNENTFVINYLQKINQFDIRTIRIIIGVEIALQSREQILNQFVNNMKSYEKAYQQQRNFEIEVRVFAYGNYIDLKRQIKKFDKKHCSLQCKSQALMIDKILSFTKNIKNIEQNTTSAKGESLELFLKYIKDRSKEKDKIDQVYLFCSKQNLSWNRFLQTMEYKSLEENREQMSDYYQLKPCIEYIKRIEQKTQLNIFCFNNDPNVKKFYQDLRDQTNCIKQLQFISKEQFALIADLYCARYFDQATRNTANKI